MLKESGRRNLWRMFLALVSVSYLTLLILGPRDSICQDEINFLYEGLRLPGERRLDAYFHGPFLYEIAALLELGGYLLLRLIGAVKTPFDFLVHFQLHRNAYLHAGQFLAVCAALGCLIQVRRLGALFDGEETGVLAAILCALNVTFIALTPLFKDDVFFWLFLLVAMESSWRAGLEQSRSSALLAGAALGAALATKHLAAMAVPTLLYPWLFAGRNRPGARLSLEMAAAAAASFLFFFPFVLTDTGNVVSQVFELSGIAASYGTRLAMPAYLRYHVGNAAGWSVLALGVIELFRRLRREPLKVFALCAPPLLIFLFMGLHRGRCFAYYVYPLAIALMILACSFIVRASPRLSLPPLVLAAILLLLDPIYLRDALKYALLLTGPDTRELARSFIESRAQPGEAIVMNFGVHGDNAFGPQLAASNTAEGHGAFTKAKVFADRARQGPKYALRIVNSDRLARPELAGMDWIVFGQLGRVSSIDYGLPLPYPEPEPPSFAGYKLAGRVEAFPPMHSKFFPLLSELDYDELSRVSLGDVWKRHALGLSFWILQRRPNR